MQGWQERPGFRYRRGASGAGRLPWGPGWGPGRSPQNGRRPPVRVSLGLGPGVGSRTRPCPGHRNVAGLDGWRGPGRAARRPSHGDASAGPARCLPPRIQRRQSNFSFQDVLSGASRGKGKHCSEALYLEQDGMRKQDAPVQDSNRAVPGREGTAAIPSRPREGPADTLALEALPLGSRPGLLHATPSPERVAHLDHTAKTLVFPCASWAAPCRRSPSAATSPQPPPLRTDARRGAEPLLGGPLAGSVRFQKAHPIPHLPPHRCFAPRSSQPLSLWGLLLGSQGRAQFGEALFYPNERPCPAAFHQAQPAAAFRVRGHKDAGQTSKGLGTHAKRMTRPQPRGRAAHMCPPHGGSSGRQRL